MIYSPYLTKRGSYIAPTPFNEVQGKCGNRK